MAFLERKVTAQGNHEASKKSLENKSLLCTSQYKASYFGLTLEPQNGIHAKPGWNAMDLDCSFNSKPLESSEEYRQGPLYHNGFGAWSPNADSYNTALSQLNSFQGHFYPFAINYRFQHAPVNSFPQTYPCDRQFQDFQYFVVIDFEATCNKGKAPYPQEIIEFPSVIVSSFTGQLEACFQTYVRPTCNQLLSDFCKDLTGIQQNQVDSGVTLSEALISHDKWLEMKGIKNTNFAVVTWSDWDCRVMLESECRYKKIAKPPYFNRWINLRAPFHEVFGWLRCNLKEAVEKAGLAWQGRAHCGLDDAKNTARLLALLMHKGVKFSITNSLASQSSNDSTTWMPTVENPVNVSSQAQKEDRFCYCGVKSSTGMIRKPGPKQGSIFFGCGNWTAARGARCQYFKWASS